MTLDELVLEWSYRTQRGYPSMDSPSDVQVLREILEQLNLPSNTLLKNLKEMPSYLSPGELNKYKDNPNKSRISVLIRKIENDEELELMDGEYIVVANKDEVLDALRSDDIKTAITLVGTNGIRTTTSKLKKTTEFGGQDKVSTDVDNLKVRTDVKESLVILICNILSEGGNLDSFDPDSFNTNMNVIELSSNKFINIESNVQGYMETLFSLVNGYKEFSTKSKRKAESIFNNPYSIAKEILKVYSNPTFNRGELFDKIRSKCSKITLLETDKWNPGDIYLVNSDPILPEEEDSIVPWNDLFVNNWGDTDRPLVSISLKEEKYQPGRAKSYLTKFGDKIEYDLSKEEKAWGEDKYKEKITIFRNTVLELIANGGTGSPNEVIRQGDGWDGKFPEGRAKLQGTYGAYKLLNFLLSKEEASITGLFAYGQSIPGTPSANPTFFKLVGSNKGGSTSKYRYPAGSNTEMSKDEPIIIIDNSTSANLTVAGKMDIVKDGEIERTEDVSKTFRGDFGGSIGIV